MQKCGIDTGQFRTRRKGILGLLLDIFIRKAKLSGYQSQPEGRLYAGLAFSLMKLYHILVHTRFDLDQSGAGLLESDFISTHEGARHAVEQHFDTFRRRLRIHPLCGCSRLV